ncbi:carboxypeptidase-like regulatory domain-containing protein [Rhodospirillum sp. A1_3_36]|uniref:carboxypeptidase-like regulatory domain-containing protein n=1 Tax=Rhodospirillum sp. A1_3_36 TaxID=3391666 RepID=UPI0039A44258
MKSLRPCLKLVPAVLVALVLLVPAAQAHRLKLFATIEGSDIVGQAYFGGGKYPQGMTITATDPQGQPLGEALTDAEGRFRLPITRNVDYLLSAATADGHAASAHVPLAEPGENGKLPLAEPGESETGKADQTAPEPARASAESVDLDRTLTRALRPMEERIQALEEAVGARDILGGLGYILGLFGLAAWLSARKKG